MQLASRMTFARCQTDTRDEQNETEFLHVEKNAWLANRDCAQSQPWSWQVGSVTGLRLAVVGLRLRVTCCSDKSQKSHLSHKYHPKAEPLISVGSAPPTAKHVQETSI